MMSPIKLLSFGFVPFLAMPGIGAEPQNEKTSSPYREVVRRAADALLENARDTYGPEHSALILSVLDCKTGKPLEELPRSPSGVRSDDRVLPYGSNASLQMDLYRVLRELSRMTGDPRYKKAADDGLSDFLKITQHPETGLLAWGEHLSWNCLTEKADSRTYHPDKKVQQFIHEPKRKFLYFDELLVSDQQRALKYAQGLWDHQIFDQKTGNFSRHGDYAKHSPRKDNDYPKEGGYFIDTWARAYAATKDPAWIPPVRILAQRYLNRMNERGLLDFDTTGLPERVNWSVSLANLSLGIDAFDAKSRMDPETAAALQKLSEGIDKGFLSLQHEVSDPSKGFICYAFTDSGKPFPLARKKSEGYSPAWGMAYGINTTSMFVPLCYTRQAQLGDTEQGEAYRKLIVEAARLYQKVAPDPQNKDIWAGEYGMAIFTELAAFRLTGDKSFLDTAKQLGDEALRVFWKEDSALPRASSKTDYYDVIAYPDTLLLSLLALDEAVRGELPKVEISDLIR
jgi:hypothetical protein